MADRELPVAERVVLAIVVPIALHLVLAIAQFKSGRVIPLVSELFSCAIGVWIVRKETQTHPGLIAAGIVAMMGVLLLISMSIAIVLVGV